MLRNSSDSDGNLTRERCLRAFRLLNMQRCDALVDALMQRCLNLSRQSSLLQYLCLLFSVSSSSLCMITCTCACCCDGIYGPQDLSCSFSFSDSLFNSLGQPVATPELHRWLQRVAAQRSGPRNGRQSPLDVLVTSEVLCAYSYAPDVMFRNLIC